MVSLPVVYVANSFLNGCRAKRVGMKLRCDLKAENAKRIRFFSNTGDPHLRASVAFGATFFRIARISRSLLCASLGAAFIYSSIVAGLAFGMGFGL